MKSTVIVLITFLASFSASAQSNQHCCQFTLLGTVDNSTADTIDVEYQNASGESIKKLIISNKQKFTIKGTIDQPTPISFSIRGKDRSYKKSATFYIEPSEMSITLNKEDMNQSVFKGSQTQTDYDKLTLKQNLLSDLVLSGKGIYGTLSEDARRKIRKDSIRRLEFAFISAHPNSYLSPFLMKKYAGYLYRDTLNNQYNRLSPRVKASKVAQQISAYLKLPAIRPGQPEAGDIAPEFEEKDINGEVLKLSSYKGKSVVLLDFWASWCGPCLAMLPKVKDFYAKYHAAGLEVIGINMDFTTEKWHKAVDKENMQQWKNIYASKIEFSNEYPILASYGVRTIPALFLIGKDGKILKVITDEKQVDGDLIPTLDKIFRK